MKKVTLLLLILCYIASTILTTKTFITSPVFPDSWLHLGAGRIILEERKIPTHTDISFKKSAESLQYLNHTWLGDTLLALVAARGVIWGSILLLLPMLLLSHFLIWKLLRSSGKSHYICLTTLAVFNILISPFWKYHVFIFTTPLLLLLMIVLRLWRKGENKYLAFIPLIFIAWANIWGGFTLLIIGYSLIEGLLLHAQTGTSHKDKKGNVTYFIAAVLVGSLLTLINAHGFRMWAYVFTVNALLLSKRWLSNLPGALSVTNQSYTKNAPSGYSFSLFMGYALFCTTLMIVFSARVKGFFRKNISLIASVLGLATSLIWIRFIPFAIVTGIPLFASCLEVVFEAAKKRKAFAKYAPLPVVVVFYLLIIVGIFTGPFDIRYPQPAQHAKLIEEYNLPDNILTTYDITAYVFNSIYPRKVVLDALDDMLDENEIINFYTQIGVIDDTTFKDILNRNNIRTAIVTKDQANWAHNFALRKDEWALMYFDEDGYLFTHKDSIPRDLLERKSLKYVDISRNLGFDPKEATASARELEAFIKQYPDNTMALGQLATIYRIQQQFSQAENVLMQIPANKWDYTVYTEMGRLKAAQVRCEEAEQYFLRAIELKREQNYSRTVLDLAVLYAACQRDLVKAKHYFQRYNSYLLEGEEKSRLLKLSQEFGVKLDD